MERTSQENNPLIEAYLPRTFHGGNLRYHITSFLTGGRIAPRTSLATLFGEEEAKRCYEEFDEQFPKYKERFDRL